MKTLKQLEAACKKAERRAAEWHDKRETELVWHYVNIRGDMVSLFDALGKEFLLRLGNSIADTMEGTGVPVYEKDDDEEDFGVYHECTRQFISRLRRIEQKLKEWENKYYYLECATELVHRDGTPYKYCENDLAEITRKLAALGVSI